MKKIENFKNCNVCGEYLEINNINFYSQIKKDGRIYFHPECKSCSGKRSLARQNEHLEEHRDAVRKNNQKENRKLAFRKNSKRRRESGEYLEWQRDNPEKLKGYNEKRTKEKTHNINIKEWDACRLYFNYRCAYCGYAWEDHKRIVGQDLHQEHVDAEGSNDLCNCVPSCRDCNSSKHKFGIEEWYRKQSFFSEERLIKIKVWINEDYLKYIRKQKLQ